MREGLITGEDLVEETAGKKRTVRLRLLEELRGVAAMQVAAQGPNPSVKAALALAGVRAERAAMENARHEAVARKFEETAPKQNAAKRAKIKRLREARRVELEVENALITNGKLEAATAMALFAKAGKTGSKEAMEQAKAVGAKALEKILRGSGLVDKNFGLAGVEFWTPKGDTKLMATNFRTRKIRVSVKENVQVSSMQGGVETVEFWSPMKGVLNALKNIHEGKRLTFRDEAFLQCLYHEIQHTWQQNYAAFFTTKGALTRAEKELVEAINDWTARRNYYFFLRKLGVNPIMSKEMWKRGCAYQQHVSNFDALLARLEITHSRVLQSLLDDLTVSLITESPKDFNKHVSRVLLKLANKEKPYIAKTLEQLEAALKYIAEHTFMEAFK